MAIVVVVVVVVVVVMVMVMVVVMAMVARTDGVAMAWPGLVWEAARCHCHCHCYRLGAERAVVNDTLSPLAHSLPPEWGLGRRVPPTPTVPALERPNDTKGSRANRRPPCRSTSAQTPWHARSLADWLGTQLAIDCTAAELYEPG